MFTKPWHWLAFLVIGPAIGCVLMALALWTGIESYVPTEFVVIAAAFAMFSVPILAVRASWWVTKTRFRRRLEREEDLVFVERNNQRIRETRERSWRSDLR